MRLQPIVPSGLSRAVPRGGGSLAVGNYVVPEGTGAQVCVYARTYRIRSPLCAGMLKSKAVQRDPRYFSPRPESFWPERWMPEGHEHAAKQGDDFKLNTSAFVPFSFGSCSPSSCLASAVCSFQLTGPHNCAGRALALFEMRVVLAELVRRFDISLAKGMTAEVWEAGLREWSVLATGSLWVVLEERS
jgi:hypothetical protein